VKVFARHAGHPREVVVAIPVVDRDGQPPLVAARAEGISIGAILPAGRRARGNGLVTRLREITGDDGPADVIEREAGAGDVGVVGPQVRAPEDRREQRVDRRSHPLVAVDVEAADAAAPGLGLRRVRVCEGHEGDVPVVLCLRARPPLHRIERAGPHLGRQGAGAADAELVQTASDAAAAAILGIRETEGALPRSRVSRATQRGEQTTSVRIAARTERGAPLGTGQAAFVGAAGAAIVDGRRARRVRGRHGTGITPGLGAVVLAAFTAPAVLRNRAAGTGVGQRRLRRLRVDPDRPGDPGIEDRF